MSYLLQRIHDLRGTTTINKLLAITNNISKSLDSGKDVCAIFLDVSKVLNDSWIFHFFHPYFYKPDKYKKFSNI
jgi:hypothetical protein